MFISRSLKQLLSFINDKNYEQAGAKLVEISNSLVIINFIPSYSKFKSDLLPSILQAVLPITYNEQLSLRLQAESFLIHWYSLLSSFSPVYLLDVYQTLQITTLQPAAQASLLTFLTNSLHYISPEKREDYLGTCHSLLLSSQPEFLNHLTESDWELLATTFSKQIIPSIVSFLLNSPLAYAVVTFLQKDPEAIIPIIANGGKLQLLKQIIPLIPSKIPFSIQLLKNRLFESIRSQNSQFISSAIEIIILLINRPRLKSDRENWTEVFSEISNLWETTTNVSQKAAMVELFTSATKNSMIPISSLHRFMVFDKSTPTVISVSIIRCSLLFVKKQNKIPKGLIQFLKEKAIDREPLEFLAIIEFLIECFNDLYLIAPKSAEQLLDLCINPLSQYFVEQNAILRLLKSIDYSVFDMKKVRTNILDIILYFIRNPHSSVIIEVKSLIDTLNVSLPYTKLDWFEKAHLYLFLLPFCDPTFIMELLDFNLLTAASYPDAVISIANEITEKDSKLANSLFFRCLHVVFESLKVLKIDFNAISSIKKSATQEWSQLCFQLPEMSSMINEGLSNTPFGRVIDSSLYLLSATVKYVDLATNCGIDMIELANIYGTSFAVNSCKLVYEVSKKFVDFKVSQHVSTFFTKTFPFDESLSISKIAIDCLHKHELNLISGYLIVAANIDRNLLQYVTFSENDLFKTFLAFKDDLSKKDYIIKCIQNIPFADWQINEEDVDFFVNTKFDFQIHIHDIENLDEIHKKVYDVCPSLFFVDFDIVFDNENVIDDISETVYFEMSIKEYESEIETSDSIDLIEFEPELISPYKHFKPSKPLLMAFLWFSTRKNVLDQPSFEKIESYSFSQLNKDSRFVLSFLGYSNRHKYQIDVEKWTGSFTMKRNDRNSILSFVLLTSWIRKPFSSLTQNELNCITRSMNDIGIYDLSEYNLYNLYKERNGDIKMVVDSVISIDPSRFEEFPFFYDLFITDVEDFFLNKFDLLLEKVKDDPNLLFEIVSLFSRYMLPVPNVALQLYYDIPPFLVYMLKFYHTNIKLEKLPQLRPPNAIIIEKLITFFENNRHLDSFLFQLIEKFALTSGQYQRLVLALRLFPQSHPAKIHFALKYLSVVDNSSSNSISQIDILKPPSFTRHFVSVLLSPHCPKLQPKEVNLMVQKLRPIFFDFLYVGFDKINDKLYDRQFHAPPASGVLMENLTPVQISKLKHYITNISISSSSVIKHFLELSNEKLGEYYKGQSRQTVVLEISSKIIEMLTTNSCPLMYTVFFSKVIFNNAPLLELHISILRDSVLNSPESLNLFILFHMFDLHLKILGKNKEQLSKDDQSAIIAWNEAKKDLSAKITDPGRTKMLLDDDVLTSFAKLLQSNCD